MRDQNRSVQKKANLSYHSLAAQHWRREKPELMNCPFVMGIVSIE
jgi:hypothetical protein